MVKRKQKTYTFDAQLNPASWALLSGGLRSGYRERQVI